MHGTRLLVGVLAIGCSTAWAQTDTFTGGTDPATIGANFVAQVQRGFAPTKVNSTLFKLSAYELARMKAQIIAKQGNTDDIDDVVRTFGTTAYKRKWFATSTGTPGIVPLLRQGYRTRIKAGPSVNIDMTLEEIYLEYRTAPFGSLSPAAALWETTAFAGKNVTIAAGAGYAIGTEIHNLIETYDPSLNDAIGGTLDIMLEHLMEAKTAAEQQQWIDAIKALFGVHDDGTTRRDQPKGRWARMGPGATASAVRMVAA
jgi:hypothetical protein